MNRHPVSLFCYMKSILAHRDLIARLIGREFSQRFRGNLLGVAWAVLTPLLTALMFSFVFGSVFRSRWGAAGPASHADFTVIFLTGLVAHGMFAETLQRAPTLVLSNASYVKRVVFPLEILPVVAAGTALVNAAIGICIVIVLNLFVNQTVQPTLLLLPFVALPYLLLVTGVILFVSAAGVFLRDLSQLVGFVITATMFLTPIFYPMDSVPPTFRRLMWLNPLTFVVEQARAVVIFGQSPNWLGLLLYTAGATALLSAGFWWFQRIRNGFADVI